MQTPEMNTPFKHNKDHYAFLNFQTSDLAVPDFSALDDADRRSSSNSAVPSLEQTSDSFMTMNQSQIIFPTTPTSSSMEFSDTPTDSFGTASSSGSFHDHDLIDGLFENSPLQNFSLAPGAESFDHYYDTIALPYPRTHGFDVTRLGSRQEYGVLRSQRPEIYLPSQPSFGAQRWGMHEDLSLMQPLFGGMNKDEDMTIFCKNESADTLEVSSFHMPSQSETGSRRAKAQQRDNRKSRMVRNRREVAGSICGRAYDLTTCAASKHTCTMSGCTCGGQKFKRREHLTRHGKTEKKYACALYHWNGEKACNKRFRCPRPDNRNQHHITHLLGGRGRNDRVEPEVLLAAIGQLPGTEAEREKWKKAVIDGFRRQIKDKNRQKGTPKKHFEHSKMAELGFDCSRGCPEVKSENERAGLYERRKLCGSLESGE